MKKIEPLVTEKYDFENRDKTILFNFWEYRDFDAKNKPNELPSKCYSPGRDFLNKTSMKAINPVVNGECSRFQWSKNTKILLVLKNLDVQT